MVVADKVNRYIDSVQPWAMAKDESKAGRLHEICSEAVDYFRFITCMLGPVLPDLRKQVEAFLQCDLQRWDSVLKPLPAGHVILPYKHLMTRIDNKQIDALLEPAQQTADTSKKADAAKVDAKATNGDAHASSPSSSFTAAEFALVPPEPPKPVVIQPISETISIDDFARLDLRVAKILDAALVADADKLLCLTLDLGIEQRTVFAGIRSAYQPKDLIGRYTVMVANLAPRKMRFGESQGMVLAAGDGTGIYLLAPDAGAVPGMRIK